MSRGVVLSKTEKVKPVIPSSLPSGHVLEWYRLHEQYVGGPMGTTEFIRLLKPLRGKPGCEDATWLCELFGQLPRAQDMNYFKDAWEKARTLPLEHEDVALGRALYFGNLFDILQEVEIEFDETLERAALLGYPLAQILYFLSERHEQADKKVFLDKAAFAGVPEALCQYYLNDPDKAARHKAIEYAAHCGVGLAAEMAQDLYPDDSVEHWKWAIAKTESKTEEGAGEELLEEILSQVTGPGVVWPCGKFDITVVSKTAFSIGQAIADREHASRLEDVFEPDPLYLYPVNRVLGSFFGEIPDHQEDFEAVCFVVDHYKQCCADTVRAIHTWSLVARRKGVVKDVRVLIGQLIWSQRNTWHEWDCVRGCQGKKSAKRKPVKLNRFSME